MPDFLFMDEKNGMPHWPFSDHKVLPLPHDGIRTWCLFRTQDILDNHTVSISVCCFMLCHLSSDSLTMKLYFQASVLAFMRRGVFSFAKTMNLVSDIFGLPGPLPFTFDGHPDKAEKLPCHSYLEFGNCRLYLDGHSNKNKQLCSPTHFLCSQPKRKTQCRCAMNSRLGRTILAS